MGILSNTVQDNKFVPEYLLKFEVKLKKTLEHEDVSKAVEDNLELA